MDVTVAGRGASSTWSGVTYRIPVILRTGDEEAAIEHMYVTVNGVGGRPLEVFARMRRTGDDIGGLADALGRAMSGWLQAGGDPDRVLSGMEGARGSAAVAWPGRGRMIQSVPDGIAAAVRLYMER
ncbi:MAG: hypothetical protein FJX76_28915, partial [Armatimonadetes bacterium]|nr:hypothetical protein [Armatimonadota bacterium]